MLIARPNFRFWSVTFILLGCTALGCSRKDVVTLKRSEVAEQQQNATPGAEQSDSQQLADSPLQPEAEANLPLVKAKQWISEDALPWDAWYVQYLRGRRIGYFHINVSQGTSLLKIRRTKLIELEDEGQTTRYTVQVDSYEFSDGRLASFEELTSGGDTPKKTTGEFRGRGTMTITLEEEGRKEQTTLVWEEGTWGILGLQSVLLSEPMQAEDAKRAKIFLSNSKTIEPIDLVAGQWELTSLPGGVSEQLLPVVISSTEGNDFAKLKVWVDQDGLVKKSVTLDGTKISTFLVSEETASLVADEYRLKSWLGNTVPFTGQLPDSDAKSVTYLVQGSSLSMYDFWASNVRQQIKPNSALSFEVSILDIADLQALAGIQQEPPTAEDLAASALIQHDHPLIESLAERLVNAEDNRAAVVSQLTRGVRDVVEETEFSEQVLSSVDAASQLRGDCTEHAMLLVALLRNRGIPARVAGGLRLIPERRKLVYHMWTEVWLEERWVPIDGTTGDLTSILCIKMLDSPLAAPNPYAVILPVLERMPSLQMRLAQTP